MTSWSSQVAAFRSAIGYSPSQTLDIVVAAAGLLGSPFILPNSEPATFDQDPQEPPTVGRVMDVNFKGVYFTSRLAMHYFFPKSSTDGVFRDQNSLIVFGSLASYVEFPPITDYLASKAAVRAFFRASRADLAKKGCRLNLIAPDIMDTPMAKDFVGMYRSNGFSVGDPKNVVDAVIRCAADDGICGKPLHLWLYDFANSSPQDVPSVSVSWRILILETTQKAKTGGLWSRSIWKVEGRRLLTGFDLCDFGQKSLVSRFDTQVYAPSTAFIQRLACCTSCYC